MSGTTLSLIPTLVEPMEPEFNNVITQAEGKKQYQNLNTTPILKYKLSFIRMTDVNFWTLYNHYYSTYGGYDSFPWASVPSYIDTDQDGTPDGSNLTGRWVEGSFQFKPNAHSWDAEIVFEKAI